MKLLDVVGFHSEKKMLQKNIAFKGFSMNFSCTVVFDNFAQIKILKVIDLRIFVYDRFSPIITSVYNSLEERIDVS